MKAPPLRDSGYERELERQTLISEQRRAIILFWTLTLVLVIRILYIILHGFGESDLPGRGFVLLVVGCWIGLEAFTFVFLRRRIRKGKEPAPLQAYVSSALEVAMPTIAMWILCHHGTPVSALTGSLSYAYFLIIILSPLWLESVAVHFHGSTGRGGLRRARGLVLAGACAGLGGIGCPHAFELFQPRNASACRRTGRGVCQPAHSHNDHRDAARSAGARACHRSLWPARFADCREPTPLASPSARRLSCVKCA